MSILKNLLDYFKQAGETKEQDPSNKMEMFMLSEEIMFFDENKYRLNYDFEVVEEESATMKLLREKSTNDKVQLWNDQFANEEVHDLADLDEGFIKEVKRESSIDYSANDEEELDEKLLPKVEDIKDDSDDNNEGQD